MSHYKYGREGELMVSDVAVVITAIATVVAAIIAGFSISYTKKKDKDERESRITELKEEIRLFVNWYLNGARMGLNKLHSYSAIDIHGMNTAVAVYNECWKGIPSYRGNLNYWEQNRSLIKDSMQKNRYSKECIETCEDFLDEIISFKKMIDNFTAKVRSDEMKDIEYQEFIRTFYEESPDGLIRKYGANFNACLSERMRSVEVKYEKVALALKLEPKDISGVS